VLGTTTFTPENVCRISFRLLNIFEKLWHEERIALDREEEEEEEEETRFKCFCSQKRKILLFLCFSADNLDLAFQCN